MEKWRKKRLEEVVKVLKSGGTPKSDESSFYGGEIPFVTIEDMTSSNGHLYSTNKKITELGLQNSTAWIVPANSILYSIYATLGLPVINKIPVSTNQAILGIIPDEKIVTPGFLYYWLSSIRWMVNSLAGQTTQSNLNAAIVKNIEIKLPSLPEQRRIAEILGTVDAEIEQTEALLAKYQRLKTGLLAELLTHGLDTQGQRRSPQTHEYKTLDGVTVPVEWEVKRLGDIAEISSGVTLGKTYEGPGTVELPYLRVANVQDGYLNLAEITTIRLLKSQVENFLLEDGDVLMNEGGDFDKLGRGTVWRGEIKNCLHQNHVFKVRSNRKKLLPDYLAYVSGSAYGKRFFVLNSKQSTNLASINSSQLKNFPIPLPSVREQRQLIDSLDLQNETILSEKQRLQKLHALKKGLMQYLLNGPEAENGV